MARYLSGKHQKLSVNAGLSCPNRDGAKGTGGCTYCNNQSFSPMFASAPASVTRQLDAGKRFFARKYPSMRYLAYFQSYTATNASTPHLISLFHEALAVEGVDGLIIGTRPDCIPTDLLAELEQLNRKHFIMMEYGAETAHNRTLELVNRCHTWEDTVQAVERTHRAGIPVGLHLIMGLPGESRTDMLDTIHAVNLLPVDVVKIHQLQLIRGTRLARQVEQGELEITEWQLDSYIDLCCDITETLRPDIAIERFVSQSPDSLLISPRWGLKNYQFAAVLQKALAARAAK
ncbi:MAG: TIGR01212 family radical SAM protein [Firmicutes bacterium]|nr:TIGR01212 family radical SAM protein [Bacillota bacterium]MCM1476364.1 TIGR01212 family radical SAM protein [Bacteroides sp.]